MKTQFFLILVISFFWQSGMSQEVFYKYDADNRLIEAEYPNNMLQKWAYDKNGNRLSESITKKTITFAFTNNKSEDSAITISTFPNPSDGNFKVAFDAEKKEDIKIEIFSVAGQLLYDHKTDGIGHIEFNISLKPITPGIYIVNVRIGKDYKSKRVTVY